LFVAFTHSKIFVFKEKNKGEHFVEQAHVDLRELLLDDADAHAHQGEADNHHQEGGDHVLRVAGRHVAEADCAESI
jgi:hypothetical protein